MSLLKAVGNPHPRGWVNPVELRAAAVLGAAWDAAPIEVASAMAEEIMLTFNYTRGAVGGAFDWQMETSLYSGAAIVPAGAQEWATETLKQSGAVVPGAETASDVQTERQGYQEEGTGAAESFDYGPIPLKSIERLRVRALESGVPLTPGTLQITAVLI
jgi:hypothetical protein